MNGIKMTIRIISLLLAAAVGISDAEESLPSSADGGRPHSLQFRISSFFRVDSFRGSMISYQYSPGNRYALRLGLSPKSSLRESDIEYLTGSHPFSAYDFETIHWDKSIALDLQLLRFHRRERRDLFYGVGLRYSRVDWKYGNAWVNDSEDVTLSAFADSSKGDAIGFSALLGVRWWPLKWLSLHAEYSSLALYENYEYVHYRETDPPSTQDWYREKSSGWHFSSQPVLFGFSLHF